MDYAIKTLSQLRPILQGFRKAAGLTQAAMAAHLGVTQQTYAQLEANPAAVSVERLFRVLRVLQVDLKLSQNGSAQSVAVEDTAPPSKRGLSRRAATGTPEAASTRRATRVPLKQKTSSQKQTRAPGPPQRESTTSTRKASGSATVQASSTAAKTARSASAAPKPKAVKLAKANQAASTSKKREDW